MGNRVRQIQLFLIMGLIMSCAFLGISSKSAYAAGAMNKTFLVEQARGKAPNVKVYMTGTGMSDSVAVGGSIGDIALKQNGDVVSFASSKESVRYIVLFDNSGSIDPDQFETAKSELVKLRKGLKNNDEMILYTVGTRDVAADRTDVFGHVASAAESGQLSSDCNSIENIEYIEGVEAKTILYRSINEVVEEQSNQTSMTNMRTVILLVTDGEDDSDEINGKNNDKDATLNNVANAVVPIYGIILNDTAREPDEEKIKFTKNKLLEAGNCRGYFTNCASPDLLKQKTDEEREYAQKLVKDAFAEIDDIIRNKTYIISLAAETNAINVGKSELKLTVNDASIGSFMMDYSDGEEDVDAPVVIGMVEQKSKNSIGFSLEDENGVNVVDAADSLHYVIVSETDGKTWAIDQVNANPEGKGISVILTVTDEEFFIDDYTLTIEGIRDISQEQNTMKATVLNFQIEEGLNRNQEAKKALVQGYWWILLVILAVVIGVIALILIKKKSVTVIEKPVDFSEMNKADTKKIMLEVTDRLGATRSVEYNVEGSVFIGRSKDTCDIFFDDDRLSRQHFVIEITKMGCNIQDLESKNGTNVNGTKLIGKRLLMDGDVISAGREKFVFHVEDMQAPLASADEEEENEIDGQM